LQIEMDPTKHELLAEIEELRAEVSSLKAALKKAESNQHDRGVVPPEEALRESEARFRSLCESSPIGIFYTDIMGRCLYTNARWQELAGLTLAESLEEGWSRAIHPDDRAAVFAKWNRCVSEGQDFEKKFRFLKPQGEVCWVHARATAICNERGEIVGYVGTDEDISTAKLAESVRKQATVDLKLQQVQLSHQLRTEQEALRQSEALFRSLSESSPVGIFRNDAQGQCIYTNPRCRKITGATFEEMLGDGWQQFIYPEDLEKILPQRSVDITEKQGSSIELRHIHKDGSIRLCQVNSAPILSTTHELLGFVGTVEDITERRVVEQMKNEFVAIVSHELRTPLASIRGSLGLLASNVLNNDPETAKHMLDIAVLETERLVRLVTDILDLERLESNRNVLDKQWCNAATVMQQAIEILHPLATEDGIILDCVHLPVQIWVAPDRLIQTFVNLLSNAIKFSSVGSKVTLTAQRQSNCILFQVQDQGQGIPPDKLNLVFGRFQQIDSSDSRDKGGTGLGLAICRNIVQQHGGQIWVESVLGQGSTFFFTIPMPSELD
jgi:PAS domain S-box-containing protein